MGEQDTFFEKDFQGRQVPEYLIGNDEEDHTQPISCATIVGKLDFPEYDADQNGEKHRNGDLHDENCRITKGGA